MFNKYNLKKGTRIATRSFEAIISTDIMRFMGFDAIYADITQQSGVMPCCVKLIDGIALIFRDKGLLMSMELNTEERKAIYCHELGHCFSENQRGAKSSERAIEYEVDSDTFAVEKCGISVDALESALKKTYEYNIASIRTRQEKLTKEEVEKFIDEMTARKRNVERLRLKIRPKEDMQI
mgnify:CR=1 FL=1